MRSIFGCLLLLIFFATPARAVDPDKHISQYGHAVWRIQDGFFNAAPNAITQTTDGYIWIGTVAGLIRFDGVRFVPWTPPPGKSFSSSTAIYSLLGGEDGSLWIGTGTNLARLKDNNLINYTEVQGRVNSIIKDRNGTIWFTRSRLSDAKGPLCEVIDPNVRCYGKADGITSPFASPLIEDIQGNLWFGSSIDLTRWSKTSSSAYVPRSLAGAKGLSGVAALAAAPDGSLWVGMNRTGGPDSGLQRMDQGVLKPFVVPAFDGRTLGVSQLFLDRNNALWVGSQDRGGIYRIYNGRVDNFSEANGLSGDAISGFFEDREGNIWTATSEGIDCFRNTRVIKFSTREGLSSDTTGSVLATKDGTVWIGNHAALDSLRQGNISSIQAKNGLPGVQVTSMLEDHAGRLWVGVDNTLYVYEKGRFQPVNRRDGSPIGVIISITEERDNNIWAIVSGNPRKLVRVRDSKFQEEFSPPQLPAAFSVVADTQSGIWLGLESGDLARYQNGKLEVFSFKFEQSPRLRGVIAMPDGAIFGQTSAGLIGWKSGKRQTLSVQNGLPCQNPYSMVSGAQGDLWVFMKCGLVRIPNAELQKWWDNANVVVMTNLYDVFDGARPSTATFEPRATRSSDGKLWFANDYIVQMIDPNNLTANPLLPPVHIEEIIADKKSYGNGQNIRLPALTRDLEIDYTALSFVVPQKVRFRYKLEGHDTQWQDAGTRRQAFYNDLKPRKYTFRVMASNNDGKWNEIGAALEFSIAPAWYQTYTFMIVSIVAGLLAVFGLYQLRVRQISRVMSARFDERLAERTRVARELHDTLLQTVQGSKLVSDHALKDTADHTRMVRAMQQLSTWLGQATEEGRAALNSLRASTTQRNDLVEAFHRAINECREDSTVEISFSVTGVSREIHPVVFDEVYRIGYEAIRNACAHSGAKHLEVTLAYAHDLTLQVNDDGKGIDSEIIETGKEGHFGLRGMKERAERIGSKLTLLSSPGSGTALSLIVPGRVVFRSAISNWSERIRSLFSRN